VNYIVKVLASGQKYIFVLLALLVLSACSVSSVPTEDKITQLATISIKASDTQASIEKMYGAQAVVFRPEAGFAILGFTENPGLSTLATEPNAVVKSPEVSALGNNAWGGGNKAWGGGWNAWGGGWNAWGGGTGTIPSSPMENRNVFKQFNISEAFTQSKNYGLGMKVAVIDTGIDLAHPMFSGRLAPSAEWKDFVDGDSTPQEVAGTYYGHGTAAAGIVLQIAPKATILPIRVLNTSGVADVALVVSAIDWAVQKGAKIINLSLGTNVDVAALKSMVNYANSLGIYIVASAGNEGSLTTLTYPAQYATTSTNAQYLISVGSTNVSSTMSVFSNRGTALEIAAPGETIYSAYPGNQIAHATGTSFAAPVISGSLALMASETSVGNFPTLQTSLLNASWTMTGGGRHLNLLGARRLQPDYLYWRKALLVTGSTTLSSGDQIMNDRLWVLGYSVTVKSGPVATSADATGKDLVVISSTVNPTDVNTKFKTVTTPVMTWEAQLFDDMGMTSTGTSYAGTSTGQTSLKILNANHPLASGLQAQDMSTFYYSPMIASTLSWGKPATTAIILAGLAGDTTKSAIFAYDKGVQMVGLAAPARRVAFMLDDASSARVNDSWWAQWLFDAAVNWTATGN
jgi:Subtilase family